MPTFRPGPQAAQAPGPGSREQLTVAQLAHELNSLLDGALRYLVLAGRSLDDAAADDARRRLDRSRSALDDMVALLGRAMGTSGRTVDVLAVERSLGEVVEAEVRRLAPLAEEAGVDVRVEVEPGVGALPAGPLGAVVANGLANSIRAAAGSDVRRVECAVTGRPRGVVDIVITDTGPGLPDPLEADAGGHGIGLSVCASVVEGLGGRLDLMNVPFGSGAVLRVVVPASSLERP